MTWHNVLEADTLDLGALQAVEVAGQNLVVARLEDGYYAVQGRCTHVFAPLGRGRLVEGCQVQCPLHRARFDLRTGAVVRWANFPPGVQLLNFVRGEKALKTYPVRIERGTLQIEIG